MHRYALPAPVIYLTVLFTLISCIHSTKVLETKSEMPKEFTLTIGQTYTNRIPTLFGTYQNSQLFWDNGSDGMNGVCEISVGQPSFFLSRSSLRHNLSSSSIVEQKPELIISKYDDLIKLKIFIDAIQYENYLIAIFEDKEVIYYQVNEQGVLSLFQRFTINQPAIISYGNFIIHQKHCLFLSETQAYLFTREATAHKIAGYLQVGDMFYQAISTPSNGVVVAAGENGIMSYRYQAQNNSFVLMSSESMYLILEGYADKTLLSIEEIAFDPESANLFVLDSQQGLFQTKLTLTTTTTANSTTKEVLLTSHNSLLLISNCRNLVLTHLHLLMSCPQIVKININSKTTDKAPSLTFFPNQIIVNESRIILIGAYEYAIYDTNSDEFYRIEEGVLDYLSEKMIIQQSWFLSFNHQAVHSLDIISKQEDLICYTNNQTLIGTYTAKIQVQGVCTQYFQNNTSTDPNCQVFYPFTINLHDPRSLISYFIEFIVIGVLIFIACIILIYFSVQKCKIKKQIKKQYVDLQEEDMKIPEESTNQHIG